MAWKWMAARCGILVGLIGVVAGPVGAMAAEDPPAVASAPTLPIEFTEEKLDNGLRVIYAPLHQAPVVHVRVLYHVGSKDERPDRQGFAHMFEHMMFRGSAHVKPEQHMKLIGTVGGYSNAFTSFDQTVYINTVPSNHLEMALYLEADRMASFKVDENIYSTERKVVAEEWRIRQNRPYGTQYEDFLKNAFTTHSYRWTPIGNMDHLKAARVNELQDFFNTYYLPNNAVLVIAGDFKLDEAKAFVKKYYGWIPAGPDVEREIPQEPEQKDARDVTVNYRVQLPAVLIGYHLPDYKSDDHYPLALLSTILGSGNSSRLDRLLVNGEKPLALQAGASHMQLEDAGMFNVSAVVLAGCDAGEVEEQLTAAVAEVVEKGVTADELEKAKTLQRVAVVQGQQTAMDLASQLGEEELFGGNANRVNTTLAKIDAVTLEAIHAVAKKYLQPQRATTLRVNPDPTGKETRAAAAAAETPAATPVAPANAPVAAVNPQVDRANAPAGESVGPRVVEFPEDYPAGPMMGQAKASPEFQKGEETTINGVRVIVMPDPRLPLVNWSLTMRRGSHSDPKGKEGLAAIAGDMLRRGVEGMDYAQLNLELESRGISLGVSDGGDYTRLSGSSTTAELQRGLDLSRKVLLSPTFPADEFEKLKQQTVNGLALSRDDPRTVASNDLSAALYGDSPLGATPTPESVGSITLDDVKDFYQSRLRPNDAIFLVSGDVTIERGRELATALLQGWRAGELPAVAYDLPPAPDKRRIIVVDRPAGKQATVRMGVRAYDIRSEDKFAGSIAGQILSSGIDSRLGRYVRAEKGLAYGVQGVFHPGRHAGAFVGGTDTAVESTADAVQAMFKVFDDLRNEEVSQVELNEAQSRVSGGMVMNMQTIQQQAGYRVDGILNDYPLDYYDTYPEKVGAVTAAQVKQVVSQYVKDGEMVVIVVAPAEAVKEQLRRLGEVEVVPMPAQRPGATEQGKQELLKKAA